LRVGPEKFSGYWKNRTLAQGLKKDVGGRFRYAVGLQSWVNYLVVPYSEDSIVQDCTNASKTCLKVFSVKHHHRPTYSQHISNTAGIIGTLEPGPTLHGSRFLLSRLRLLLSPHQRPCAAMNTLRVRSWDHLRPSECWHFWGKAPWKSHWKSHWKSMDMEWHGHVPSGLRPKNLPVAVLGRFGLSSAELTCLHFASSLATQVDYELPEIPSSSVFFVCFRMSPHATLYRAWGQYRMDCSVFGIWIGCSRENHPDRFDPTWCIHNIQKTYTIIQYLNLSI